MLISLWWLVYDDIMMRYDEIIPSYSMGFYGRSLCSGPRVGHCLVKLKRNRVSDAQVVFLCRWLYQQRWRITRIESWGNLVTDLVIIGDDHWRHGRIFCWDAFKAALGHSSGNFRMGFSQFHGLIVMCWMLKGIEKRPMIEFQKDICAMYDRWYVRIYYTYIALYIYTLWLCIHTMISI